MAKPTREDLAWQASIRNSYAEAEALDYLSREIPASDERT